MVWGEQGRIALRSEAVCAALCGQTAFPLLVQDSMNNWVIKICLPFLLLVLVFAFYFGSGSVKSFDPQAGRGDLVVSQLLQDKQVAQRAKSSSRKVVSRLAAGERYASLKELAADQNAAGFVRVGYFGKFWPATVAEIAVDRDRISFVRQNGTRYNYTKFNGYGMKMVRLKAGAKETIVVFRSKSKR